jgi:hypothetical protein
MSRSLFEGAAARLVRRLRPFTGRSLDVVGVRTGAGLTGLIPCLVPRFVSYSASARSLELEGANFSAFFANGVLTARHVFVVRVCGLVEFECPEIAVI